jgi:putative pyruvate formate lyase activating enzyme
MALPSYFEILSGNLVPRFRISARLPTGLSETGAEILTLDELAAIHRKSIEPFAECPNPSSSGRLSAGEMSLLELKALIARRMLESCELCENRCRVNRIQGKRGKCRVGEKSYYASEFLHLGEEPELIPSHTVFFTGCTFECLFCQNSDIAHGDTASLDAGMPVDERLTARILERAGYARNLNLVGGDPGQHLATIMKLLIDLNSMKYSRPIVWNSNLYASQLSMELLRGAADLHLADFKYGLSEHAKMLSGIDDYWEIVTRNLLEAKPVADILIRHLVLPGHVECCTSRIVKWVAENLPDATFNLMFQYHPEYRADEAPEINRYLSGEEKNRAMELARGSGVVD